MKRLLLIAGILYSCATFSQTSGKTPVTTNAIPKIAVTLAGYKSGNISGDALSHIVDSALVVRDDKGNAYPITKFRILYHFKSSYEDPETGQKKTVDDLRTNEFSNTDRLTELWSQSIKDNITKGDELTLDNIIVKLKNGTKLMAPAITFKVL